MKTEKKRIALITAWFPPKNGVAVNRMLAFAQHLSEDFDVEVFALDDRQHSSATESYKVHYNADNWLSRLLRGSTRDGRIVHNFKTLCRIVYSKLNKNPLQAWRTSTVKQLAAVHAGRPFDLVISSYAPKEAHLIVLDFLELFPGVPWIADMRDDMSTNPLNLPHLNADLRKLEALVARKASAITSVSEPIVKDFMRVAPGVRHYAEIRNGYNHEVEIPAYNYAGNVFRLGHFGSFYGVIKPTVFLEALKVMKERNPAFDFRLDLTGAYRNFDIPREIERFVTITPAVPYETAIRLMTEVDALVLINPASARRGVFTGKLFDYLSVRRTILALVDKTDVAADLVRATNAGYVGECTDLEENVAVLTQCWNDWKAGALRIISEEDSARQHRRFQSDKLKTLIDEILAETPAR